MTFLLNLKYTYLYTYLIFINILIYTGFPKVLGDSWYSVNCFFGVMGRIQHSRFFSRFLMEKTMDGQKLGLAAAS